MLRQRELDETHEVGSFVDHTGAVIEGTRCGTTDRDDLMQRYARILRRRSRRIRESANDRVGAVPWSVTLIARDDVVAVGRQGRDDCAYARAAKIDAEEVVVAQTLGSLPASSGDDSTLASPSITLFCAAL